MRRRSKLDFLLIHLALICFTGYTVCLSPGSLWAEEPGAAEARKVVARVNGKPIYEEQLKPRVERDLSTYRKYGMREETPELINRLQGRALEKLISEELIFQASRRRTIEDLDEKVELKLEALKKKHGTEERFAKYLKLRNLTLEGVRESLRTGVYVDEYLKAKGISEPEISEQRIRETYDQNPAVYSRKDAVKVSHILIAVDEAAGVEEKEHAAREAAELREQALNGKDFAELAKQHSDCNSASGGGDLGYIKRGYMPKAFDDVAFATEKGAVGPVVKTKFGYHVVKVFEKKSAGITPYEEVKGFIEKYLQEKESNERRAAHIAELKKGAEIEILLNASEDSALRETRVGASIAIATSSP